MAHMHNIWFNRDNHIYRLSKDFEVEKKVESTEQDSWVLIASFDADTLENIVDGFHSISKAHQNLSVV